MPKSESLFLKAKLKAERSIYYRKLRARNHNTNPTIISQNCIGGVIYSELGLQFLSPTINGFIEGENFCKLVEDLPRYITFPPRFEGMSEIGGERYPMISIDDVLFHALHFRDPKDAIETWTRRCTRVNLDNVFVIGNAWNMGFDERLISRLCSNHSYKKTILFSDVDYSYDNCIVMPGDFWTRDERGIVRPNLTDRIPGSYKRYFETFFDFVGWLNE